MLSRVIQPVRVPVLRSLTRDIRNGIYEPAEDGGGFSPASLFAMGEQGAWYDPSDLSTLWQDSARTTPVTADGQPVGAIDDKSGNGNHLIQNTTSLKPIYKTSGGLNWLKLDGVDDKLEHPTLGPYAQYTAICGLSNDTFSGEMAMMTYYTPFNGFIPTRSSTNFGWYLGTGGSFINPQIAYTGVIGQTEVQSSGYDGTAHQYRHSKGSFISTATTNGSTYNPTFKFTVGKGTVGNSFDGRFYGGLYINRYLTTTEQDNYVVYVGAKGGRAY
jgi:hypothetical protein